MSVTVCVFVRYTSVETKHNPRTEQGCNVHLVRCQVEGIENVKQVVCLCVCVFVPNKDVQVLVGNNLPRDRKSR